MEKNKIIVLDRGDYTTCTVNLQGATVTSWRINNQEQLFVSRRAHSHELAHIIGGIQVVFPHFGLWNFGPPYGFARNLPWILEDGPRKRDTEDVAATFSLSDDAYTHSLWGYRVPDVHKCEVEGLKTCTFKNLHHDDVTYLEKDKETVKISRNSDKIYKNVEMVRIKNMGRGGVLKVHQKHTSDFSLWNPGPEKSPIIPNLGEHEYKQLIAIKTGVSTYPIHLEPMSSWRTIQSFEIVEPDREKKLIPKFFDFLGGFC